MNISIAKERINQVIQVDTNANTKADFLATHVPFKKIKIKQGGGRTQDFKSISEEEIFDKYVRDPGDRHQFIVVQGSSGSGKSHLIRWLATKADSIIDNKKETVKYIKRSDNSLKGAIRQLLDMEEVENLPNRELYKRLAEAGTNISGAKLRDRIYHNFIVEIMNDTDTSILTRIDKKKLVALLQDDIFQDYFLHSDNIDSPIDRIYRKVVPTTYSKGVNDQPALFSAEDFATDNELVLNMTDSDRKARELAEKLNTTDDEDNDYPGKVANYLNKFVDPVIQECAGLQAGDFENIFKAVRQELYRQGRNLTLLIEDITAFTGVNSALLNVLTDVHTGVAAEEGQELCRLSSIVGTTTQYYEEFRDNFVNRITEEIYIEDDAVTSESSLDTLIEFVAKYLNAMSLPKKTLEDWVKYEGKMEDLPVHEPVEGKEWEFFELAEGKRISLYPFTRKAIVNLTAILTNEHRIPRFVLEDVVLKTVQDIMNDCHKFPSFVISPSALTWSSASDRIFIRSQFSPGEPNPEWERINKFVCIWGNKTAEESVIDGISCLAGVPISVYRELGFEIGLHGKETAPQEKKEIDQKGKTVQDKDHKETPVPERQEADEKKIQAYQIQSGMLNSWASGGMLNDDRNTLRKDINGYLFGAINWQEEGISFDNARLAYDYWFVGIERQSRSNAKSLMMLPATSETLLLLDSFEKWRYLGDCSWDYQDADESIYYVTSWVESIKPELLKKVNSYEDGRKVLYAKCAFSYYAFSMLLRGQNFRSSDNITAMEDMIISNYDSDISGTHCKSWLDLKNGIIKDPINKDSSCIIRDYYNIKQDASTSSVYFFNRIALNNCLNELRNSAFLINDLEETNDPIPKRNKYIPAVKKLYLQIHQVAVEEIEFVRLKTSPILENFDIDSLNMLLPETVEEFCDETLRFIKAVQRADLQACTTGISVANINSIKNDAAKISTACSSISKALDKSDDFGILKSFATDPMGTVMKFVYLLNAVNDSIYKFTTEYNNSKEFVQNSTRNMINATKDIAMKRFESIQDKLNELRGENYDH